MLPKMAPTEQTTASNNHIITVCFIGQVASFDSKMSPRSVHDGFTNVTQVGLKDTQERRLAPKQRTATTGWNARLTRRPAPPAQAEQLLDMARQLELEWPEQLQQPSHPLDRSPPQQRR